MFLNLRKLIAYNVPSISEVPQRGIWAEVRSTEAGYALLSEVFILIYSSNDFCIKPLAL